jgi:glycosyltransferase involved in cell wall biosynthesis
MTTDAPRSPPSPLLCVVTPCFQEEEVVGDFYRELKAVLSSLDGLRHRIVFVDDGSTDGTLRILNALAAADPSVSVYSFARNFGHQAALTCGLDQAGDPDAVVVMDADLQHPPSLIPQLVAEWRRGCDVVHAVRQDTAGVGFLKRISSGTFYRVFNALSDTQLTPGAADFFLLSGSALHGLRQMPEYHRFLRGMVAWMGFARATVPFRAAPRTKGVSKYTRTKMMALAKDAVFAFSSKPLRIVSRLGLFLVILGALYFLEVLWEKLAGYALVPGWATVVGVVLVLGGAQLLTLGLIGEYLSRIFDEVKRRPPYILKQGAPLPR